MAKLDIKRLAELAKVTLTKDEEKQFEKDLEGILAYADQITELDTSGVEGIIHAAPEMNRLREDMLPKNADNERAEEATSLRHAFPNEKEGYTKVPLIIKHSVFDT